MNKPFNPIALHRLLKHASKADILKMLQQRVDLQQLYENGDTVYHVVLRNKVLKEEEITTIFQVFLDRRLNPAYLNDYSKAPLHLATEYRMKNVVNFLMIKHSPRLLDSPYVLTRFFIKDETVKFRRGAEQHCGDSKSWNSEKIESASADFFEWLILKELSLYTGSNQNNCLDLLGLLIEHNLQHITLALLNLAPVKLIDTAHPKFFELFHRFFKTIVRARMYHNKLDSKDWYASYSSRYASKILKIFLDNGATVDYSWEGDLRWAVKQKENINVIKLLLDHFSGNDCSKRDFAKKFFKSMLQYPCPDFIDSEVQVFKQILRNLVAKGAKFEDDYLDLVLEAQNVPAAEFLKEIRVYFPRTLLLQLARCQWDKEIIHQSENQKMCEWLVNEGHDVNVIDNYIDQQTPLHLAAKHENVALARKLIEFGADINYRDYRQQTPLHYAVINNGSIQLAKVLLQNGADIEAKDGNNESPLIMAIFPPYCRKIKFQMVRLLLNWGAKVDALYATECITDHRYSWDYRSKLHVKTFLNQHCVKLIAAGLLVTKNCRSHLEVTSDPKFYQECLKELETLKSSFISSCISLYHYLHMNLDHKSHYVKNEELKKLVHPAKIEKKFPLYSNIILAGYRASQMRNSLLERAKVAWLELTKIYLPDLCIERILFYMSSEELKVIVRPQKRM